MKKYIIAVSAITTSAIFLFFGIMFFSIEQNNFEVKGARNMENIADQEELWANALSNFASNNGRYKTLGIIKGSRFGFEFTFQIEAFIDGNNADTRIFNNDSQDEVFFKNYNDQLYLSESSTLKDWYLLDLSDLEPVNQDNLSVDNLVNLKDIASNLDENSVTYSKSESCGDEICQIYFLDNNNQEIEVVVNEFSKEISELRLNNNGNIIVISFEKSNYIVEEPQNITQLNSIESTEISQNAVANIVRSSIF